MFISDDAIYVSGCFYWLFILFNWDRTSFKINKNITNSTIKIFAIIDHLKFYQKCPTLGEHWKLIEILILNEFYADSITLLTIYHHCFCKKASRTEFHKIYPKVFIKRKVFFWERILLSNNSSLENFDILF